MHHLPTNEYYSGLLTWRGNWRALERLNVAIAGNIDWLHEDSTAGVPQMQCRAQVERA